MFYNGMTDYEIQQTLNVGSISTIRNHRYALKEKEKQARVFLTLMGLLASNSDKVMDRVKPHKTATMVDDRYDVSMEESIKLLKSIFQMV